MQIVPRQKIQHSFTDILKDPTPDNKHVDRGYQDYMDGTIHGEDNVSNLKQVSSLFFSKFNIFRKKRPNHVSLTKQKQLLHTRSAWTGI